MDEENPMRVLIGVLDNYISRNNICQYAQLRNLAICKFRK